MRRCLDECLFSNGTRTANAAALILAGATSGSKDGPRHAADRWLWSREGSSHGRMQVVTAHGGLEDAISRAQSGADAPKTHYDEENSA